MDTGQVLRTKAAHAKRRWSLSKRTLQVGNPEARLLIDSRWLWSSRQDVQGVINLLVEGLLPATQFPPTHGRGGYGFVGDRDFTEIEKPPTIIKQRADP